uniref:Uncharacterized protein n=1 Tax=Entomoneis paludosa TaxID=265537 RepID=A0A7S2VCJ0_9STRA
MLLQPFFSPNHSDRTVVTMLVTASASHRDYMEKRMLLEEIETLWKPFHRVSVQAATGLDDEHDATKRVARPVQQNRSTSRSRRNSQEHEVSPKVVPIILHAPKVEDFGPPISIASSGSSDDYSLPPPIAPPTPSLLPAEPLSYRASAPLEEDHYQKYVIPMDTSKSPITDFPDAIMGSGKLPSEVNEPTPGSLYSSDQMNSLPIPKPPAPRRQVKPSKKSQSRSVSSKKLRARSRSPLRPAPRAGNELTRAASESSIVPEKTHSRIASSHNGEFPKKKKWSRTVETTTTVVESSDDPLESHTPNNPATTRKDEVGLPSEMDNLRRQNETLQRELAMLRSKSRKSVTWRDDNALDDDHAHAEQHNRSTSGYEANKSQRSHSTMRSGRLMDTPVLREQMARYKSTSSERNRPEVYSINQAGTGFENSHYPDRSRNRRPWED